MVSSGHGLLISVLHFTGIQLQMQQFLNKNDLKLLQKNKNEKP